MHEHEQKKMYYLHIFPSILNERSHVGEFVEQIHHPLKTLQLFFCQTNCGVIVRVLFSSAWLARRKRVARRLIAKHNPQLHNDARHQC